jgi:catechol 2,3-dioxygenase-like lactoylglutathione lyase family enzyme
MTRFSHVVVNVSDLEHSVDFYTSATPLHRTNRTAAPRQSFQSLGIPLGQFDGWLLRDPSLVGGPAVHLVEWQSPKPIGSPYADFWHVGFFRICFTSTEMQDLYQEVIEHGCHPFTGLVMPDGENVTGRPAFSLPDPDGVVLQNITMPGVRRLYHTALNCSDLNASSSFLELLGLRRWFEGHTQTPVTNHFGRGGELSTYRAAFFEGDDVVSPDGGPIFSLDLCRWTMPEPTGSPYRHPNNVGIARIGIAVDDIERVRSNLIGNGFSNVSEPEIRNFGSEVGTRTVVAVRDPDGAWFELVDRPL